MFVRPLARRPVGRGGLVGTAARTAVVAGTASAVAGGVARRQQQRSVQQAEAAAYEQQQAAPPPPPPPPPAPAPAAAAPAGTDTIAELERLSALKVQGVLTEEEFAAAKAQVLGT